MAHPHLYVADTNNHKIKVVDLKEKTVQTVDLDGLKPPAPAPRTPNFPNAWRSACRRPRSVPAGRSRLMSTCRSRRGSRSTPGADAVPDRDPGQDRPALKQVPATGGEVSPPGPSCTITVPLAKPATAGDAFELKLSLAAFVCNEGSNLYRVQSYVWTIPVSVAGTGARTSR